MKTATEQTQITISLSGSDAEVVKRWAKHHGMKEEELVSQLVKNAIVDSSYSIGNKRFTEMIYL